MLLESYLKRQISQLPAPSAGILSEPSLVMGLAGIRTLIFTSCEPFYVGIPSVAQYFAVQDQTFETKQAVLAIAGSLAKSVDDPFYQAIALAASESPLGLRELETDPLASGGVIGKLERTWYVLGPESTMAEEAVELGVSSRTVMRRLEAEGKEVLFLAQKQPKRLLGIFAMEQTIKLDAAQNVAVIRKLGIEPVLMTGQKTSVAKSLAVTVGIEQVHSELDLPSKRNLMASYAKTALAPAFILTHATAGLLQSGSCGIGLGDAPGDARITDLHVLPDLITNSRELVRKAQKVFFWKKLPTV